MIEPLQDYHKDEVRELGTRLGLPSDLVWRQPFPGPGLAIRIMCTDQPFKDSAFDRTNAVLKWILNQQIQLDLSEETKRTAEQLKGVDLTGIHATLLPVKTVGVQGDSRSYQYAVGLSGKRDWKTLFILAKAIPQVCSHIHSQQRSKKYSHLPY